MPLMPFTRSSGTTFTIFSRVGAKGIGQKGAPYRRMGASRYSMASSATVAEISAPLEVDGEALQLAPSIGIARSPDDAADVQELIRCAMRSANLAAGDPAVHIVFYDPAEVFDPAILGIVHGAGREPVVLYDEAEVLRGLQAQGMSEEQALEWYTFNTLGNRVGPATPAFLVADMEEP